MLRLCVLLLLLANGLFYVWANGFLSQWGLAAPVKNESFRWAEQIEPERIVIRPTGTSTTPTPTTNAPTPTQAPVAPVAPSLTAIAATPTTCLTAGVFNDKQSGALKQALDAQLPNMRWRFDTSNVPARWIVYMGKYPNNTARDLKKSQLDQINVRYEVLTEGSLEPGLSLGSHATQAAANQSLQQLVKQGVRTARVLQESPEQKGQTLVVPAVDDASRVKLNAVYAALAAQLANKSLQLCKG
jgi:hypothetical protein